MSDWRRGMVLNPKDPLAVIDYEFRWTDWLAAGESIASQSVTVAAGLTLDVANIENAGKSVRAWLSGGADGEKYSVTCQITTDSVPARTQLRSVNVEVATQ